MAGRHSVLVTYLHPNVVSHSFMDSLWAVADYERSNRELLWRRFPVRSGPGSLDESRNVSARIFLDQSECEWLWFVDTDMGFKPDTLSRLADAAHPDERPVMGALCFALLEGSTDGMGGWYPRTFPTMYGWGPVVGGGEGFLEPKPDGYPENAMVQVAGTGMACLLVHRTVLQEVRDKEGDEWFTRLHQENGRRLGEDLSFCCRVAQLDKPMYVHTGIQTTHHKPIWLGQ